MLLGEYFLKRCGGDRYKGLACSDIERRNFKIPDLSSGWLHRIKDIEISDDIILDTCNKLIKANSANKSVIQRITSIKSSLNGCTGVVDRKSVGKDYLYVMENELGMYKVGVSKTPELRARSLANGSGLEVELVAYFIGTEPAIEVEQHILKTLKVHLKLGEWFKLNSITIRDIEVLLPNSYHTAFRRSNENNLHTRRPSSN